MPNMDSLFPLSDISSLQERYISGELTPSQLVEIIHAEIQADTHSAWIHRLPLETLKYYAETVEKEEMSALALYGIPFAIKDNIDLAGVPTTAACPEFAYTPQCSATVVQRLIDAGAIPIGKTNLDQFATGLNGTRSPYGACRNAFNPNYISGGSSSGSAVVLAKGLVCFSLGTDTAGSGRVPAAFNNIIGYKPTKGLLSLRGVVPACRSLDCVSIFAFTAVDAGRVFAVAAGYDPQDIYSREQQKYDHNPSSSQQLPRQPACFGLPHKEQLQFFGNQESERLFSEALKKLQALGNSIIEIDFSPFTEAARLLYEGPWVAERYTAIQNFFDTHNDQVISPVREIIEEANRYSATDVFNGLYRLRALKQQADRIWSDVDFLLTPTTGTIYRIQEILEEPVRLNANLGYYTNFMNLLDYSAVAVPAGFQNDGLPFGITLVAPAHRDVSLLHLASRLQQAYALPLGTTGYPLVKEVLPNKFAFQDIQAIQNELVRIVVCGAHLSGLPLNEQLTSRGGRLVISTTTSCDYRLYALPGGPPDRPGLVHVENGEQGSGVEVEVWELPVREFGSFVAAIPAPLSIGTVKLADSSTVQGFLCERYAVISAKDISSFGSWRTYLQELGKA